MTLFIDVSFLNRIISLYLYTIEVLIHKGLIYTGL